MPTPLEAMFSVWSIVHDEFWFLRLTVPFAFDFWPMVLLLLVSVAPFEMLSVPWPSDAMFRF